MISNDPEVSDCSDRPLDGLHEQANIATLEVEAQFTRFFFFLVFCIYLKISRHRYGCSATSIFHINLLRLAKIVTKTKRQ